MITFEERSMRLREKYEGTHTQDFSYGYIRAESPYNKSSRMHRLYEFMRTGDDLDIDRITAESTGYPKNSMSRREWMILRRRITAALRTIRRQDNGVTILYDPKTETYQMVREEI